MHNFAISIMQLREKNCMRKRLCYYIVFLLDWLLEYQLKVLSMQLYLKCTGNNAHTYRA